MDFFRTLKTRLSAGASPEEQDAVDTAGAAIEALGKGVCKMLDHWMNEHPNAPLVRQVIVRTTRNGTFIDFHEDLARDLPAQIRSECSKEVMKIVEASNALRDALPQCAMPFVGIFHTEAYCGRQGTFHKIDFMNATIAGLSFSASMLAKLAMIEAAVNAGTICAAKDREWDLLRADTGKLEPTITAGNAREANLKAAATELSADEMKILIDEGTVPARRARAIERLHVSERHPNVLAQLDAKVLEEAIPA